MGAVEAVVVEEAAAAAPVLEQVGALGAPTAWAPESAAALADLAE